MFHYLTRSFPVGPQTSILQLGSQGRVEGQKGGRVEGDEGRRSLRYGLILHRRRIMDSLTLMAVDVDFGDELVVGSIGPPCVYA